VDTIPPATPVITTNGGADFDSPSANLVLRGTTEFGVTTLLVNGDPIAYTPNSSAWSVPINLIALGSPAHFSVAAVDAAGNMSGTAEITISYVPAGGDGDGGAFPPAPPGTPVAAPVGLALLAASAAGIGVRRM